MKALREIALVAICMLSAAGVVTGLVLAIKPNPPQDAADELRESNDELQRQRLLTFERECVDAGKRWSRAGDTYTCAPMEEHR